MSVQQGNAERMLAVIVLYRQSPEQSAAYTSLLSLRSQVKAWQTSLPCLLYDNSPEPHPVEDGKANCSYIHDAENPGLAKPYQIALDKARAQGISWLLLLDQDTVLTEAFLQEAFARIQQTDLPADVVALVPKLLQDGDVLSPHWPRYGKNRGSFRAQTGLVQHEVAVYNSGSVLRTKALHDMGGFPSEFPLDSLDHAVFRKLHRSRGRVLLMHACLEHHLNTKNSSIVQEFRSSARLHSIMQAQSRFYWLYGSRYEQLRHVLQRLKMSAAFLQQGQARSAFMLLGYTLHPDTSKQAKWH